MARKGLAQGHWRFLCIVLLGICSVNSALAAEMEEIVVTARGTEETIREVPVAITAVGEELSLIHI